jgi:hypothetical protein
MFFFNLSDTKFAISFIVSNFFDINSTTTLKTPTIAIAGAPLV